MFSQTSPGHVFACAPLTDSTICLHGQSANGSVDDSGNVLQGRSKSFLAALIIHLYTSLLCIPAAVKVIFLEFATWLRDPSVQSRETQSPRQAKWQHRYPCCTCRFCDTSQGESWAVSVDYGYQTMGAQVVEFVETKIRGRRAGRLQDTRGREAEEAQFTSNRRLDINQKS